MAAITREAICLAASGLRRSIVEAAIRSFAAWPPAAPEPLRRLLRHRMVRSAIRRMPKPFGRVLLRPLVDGHLSAGGRGVICIVSHSFAASGAPKVIFDITVDLIAAGYRVIVMAHADGPYRMPLAQAGAIVVIDPMVLTGASHATAMLRHADAVICSTILCRRIVDAVAEHAPVFWYIHESAMIADVLASDPSIAATFRKARGVWSVSERAASFIRPARADVDIVPPGTAALLEKGAVPPCPGGSVLRLAVFAGLEARKGHDLLAAAVLRLPDHERARLDITVFGEVLDRAYADAWLRQIEGLTNYRFAGPLAPQDVAAKLITCHGVIVPSRDESLSLVAVEAMSVGRLVLCSTCCGVAETLANGVTAFVADGCTPAALAAMLADALRSESRWGEIAEAGYTVYRSHFTRSVMSSRVLAILDPVIGLS